MIKEDQWSHRTGEPQALIELEATCHRGDEHGEIVAGGNDIGESNVGDVAAESTELAADRCPRVEMRTDGDADLRRDREILNLRRACGELDGRSGRGAPDHRDEQ